MKHRILPATLLAGLSVNAYAHPGDHGEHILANIMHWLSSPTHSLFAVIGGAIVAYAAVKLVRKKNV